MLNYRRKPKTGLIISLVVIFAVVIAGIFFLIFRKNAVIVKHAEDFNITTVKSSVDFNGNSVDDYTDILIGARKEIERKPIYNGSYQKGGYPPENMGVCSDVVWRAFKNAGYDLKDMVDSDIKKNPDKYTNVKKPDSNIDFRRVKNLKVFFENNALKLTTDKTKIKEWQPGDIVIFGNASHIGIISDKRDYKGYTYVLHHNTNGDFEEDYLSHATPTGHYRFDASKLEKSNLIAFHD